MIDWVKLLFHVCWILGASLMLANYSLKDWGKRESIPTNFYSPRGRRSVELLSVLMIGVGLSMTAHLWWQRLLWLIISLLLLLQRRLDN